MQVGVELDEISAETSPQTGTERNEEAETESGGERRPAEIPF